jgi:hypothetical protein
MAIQWFPGHMHSTRKAIAERLPEIDVVIEAARRAAAWQQQPTRCWPR